MIISIVGSVCAGKTTTAEALQRALGLPILTIGQFRNALKDEPAAWQALAEALRPYDRPARGPEDCVILVTTGLNVWYKFIMAGFRHVITVKLIAPKRILHQRCKDRSPHDDGWFPYDITRPQFIERAQPLIKRLPADLTFDTSKQSTGEIVAAIIGYLQSKILAKEEKMLRFAVVPTALGDFGLVGSEKGLRAVILPRPEMRRFLTENYGGTEDPAFFADLAERLQRYALGEPVAFDDVLLDIKGSRFQEAVWQATRAIPWGETRTYGQIAQAIGRPKAARAVGAAQAANPVPIVVPCHRVIGANGRLCGYGGGLALKERLLALERARTIGGQAC